MVRRPWLSGSALVVLAACRPSGGDTGSGADAGVVRPAGTASGAASVGAGAARDWTRSHDFDGDSRPDAITYTFSGGAHCCYRFTITPSSTGKEVTIPFELDGGYVGGLDLSQPERLTIVRDARGVAELRMEIATYSGQPSPLPKAWRRTFGIRTHHVTVSLPGGRLAVRDTDPARS